MLRVLLAATISLASQSGGAPNQPPPAAPVQRKPGPLPPMAATQIDLRQVTLDSPRRLSLGFAEPRPIDEVLALLTAGTVFSVSIDTDATGVFRGDLKQLTLREALTAVLAPLGLDFQAQGSVIRVTKRQLETRLFDIDMLSVQRGLARVTGTPAAQLSTSAAPDDIAAGVADGVKTLLSDRGRVHVDRRAGLVEVTDFADRLDRIALYVETLHQRSGRQVRLQAQAFEVTLHGGATLDWRLVRAALGLVADAPTAGLGVDSTALRTALASQGDVRVLWAPDVTTINNEPAMLRMTVPGGTSLAMTVVPQISADGIVQMSITHSWEDASADRQDRQVSEADTVTRVMDGNTAVIAGMVRTTAPDRVELVVLLRPTVVTPGKFTGGSRE